MNEHSCYLIHVTYFNIAFQYYQYLIQYFLTQSENMNFTSPFKIGIFDPYLDTLGGGEKYMLSAAHCLSVDNNVSVFWDDKKLKKQAGERFGIDLKRVEFIPNIFSNDTPFLKRILFTRDFDILLILSDGSIPLSFAKKTFLHFQTPIEKSKLSVFDKLKISRISGVICNSFYTKNHIDREFGVKSAVIYPPVDTGEIIKTKVSKENIILTVGRYNRLADGSDFKKIEVLIDFFNKISSEIPDWEFVIVTTSLPQDKIFISGLEKKIKGSKIKIYKDLNYRNILELYLKAKIYWHATGFGENLKKYPERAEHFGMSTVEAMASGAVPAVINLGGQKEIVKNNENGFLWNTLQELHDLTKSLIKDNKKWDRLSVNARESSKRFGKKIFCKELLNFIR